MPFDNRCYQNLSSVRSGALAVKEGKGKEVELERVSIERA